MLSIAITLVLVLGLAPFCGLWIKKVMGAEIHALNLAEKKILGFMHIPDQEMNWKQYAIAFGSFSLLGFLVLFALLIASGFSWDMALNAAMSFVTNTDWQAYDPALLVRWPVQVFGFLIQNFVSAAAGICILYALIRGLIHHQNASLGNFYRDMLRVLLFILLPLNLIGGLLLASEGTMMQLKDTQTSALIEPAAIDAQNRIIEGAHIDEQGQVFDAKGQLVSDARVVDQQLLPSGLMAAAEAIKQSGTNGGGYTSANSASPLENPSAWTNIIQNVLILLLPVSLCFAFGLSIGHKRQGFALFAAMSILFGLALGITLWAESGPLAMAGKEVRIGVEPSALWMVSTTATASGSTNASLNAMQPLSILMASMLMQTGEVIFGGVGTGLIAMLGFVLLTVFLAGLMVGRTPEFLQKKIEPKEMKGAMVLCLCAPICILVGSTIGSWSTWSQIDEQAHGFTQILYAFTSLGANNGSALGGLSIDTPWMNVLGTVLMGIARFIPLMAALSMAGSLGVKKATPQSAGTLKTDTLLFTGLLVMVILLVGALSFFPALALGPVAEILG